MIGIGAMFLSLVLIILAFTKSALAHCSSSATTPDNGTAMTRHSWAETHVLTPDEIATIVKLRDELEINGA